MTKKTKKKNASKKTAAKAKAKVKAKTKLLSGGNPQIAKGDGPAPVKAYITSMPGWKRNIGKKIDAIVMKAVPNVQKACPTPPTARRIEAQRRATESYQNEAYSGQT